MKNFPTDNLKNWFLLNRRDLPWRNQPSPYAVWISEVMLQQTQVSVVIPYFLNWMQQFPTIESLAQASLDQVIKAWEGLGYYSRARHLHEGAKYVMEYHSGVLPQTEQELRKIKGLGAYTVGAIRSFAFKQKASAVDGNVIRVLSRFFSIKEDISKPKTLATIRLLADSLVPEKEPWVFNEALIELGATVCGRRPQCLLCPISQSCRAFKEGLESQLPFKSTKTFIQTLQRAVFVIQSDDKFLIKRGEAGKIMSDLYEFPYWETNENAITPEKLISFARKEWNLCLNLKNSLPETRHSFTRYRVNLFAYFFLSQNRPDFSDYQWLTFSELKQKAFSSGHRRVFQSFMEAYEYSAY